MAGNLRIALRASVERLTDPPRLRDRDTGVELALPARQIAVAAALAEGIDLRAAASAGPLGEGEAADLVRTLRFVGFASGLEAPERASAARAARDIDAHAREAPLRAVEGARFACHSCGACCRSFARPVTDADARRIRALPLAEAFPHLGGRDPFREGPRLADGRTALVLAARADGASPYACVFLDEATNLCLLHARFGADAKPLACRLFPHGVVRTPAALHVYDRGECESFGVAAMTGAPIADDLRDPARAALFREAPGGLFAPPVVLGRGLAMAFEHYLAVEPLLLALARSAAGTAVDALRCLRNALVLLPRAVREAPLDADPRAVIAAFARTPPARFAAARRATGSRGATSTSARAARERLLGALVAAAEHTADPSRPRVSGAAEFYERLLPRFLAIGRGAIAAPPGAPGGSEPGRRPRLDLRDPAVDRHLRALLGQLVWGKALLGVEQAPLLGLGWIAAALDLILAGAEADTAADTAASAEAAGADRAGSAAALAARLTRAQVPVLRALRDPALIRVVAAEQDAVRAWLQEL